MNIITYIHLSYEASTFLVMIISSKVELPLIIR